MVPNLLFPFPLHLQGIDGFFRRLPFDLNLHDTEDRRILVAEDAHRELRTSDKLLHEKGRTISF